MLGCQGTSTNILIGQENYFENWGRLNLCV